MKRYFLFLLLASLLFSACSSQEGTPVGSWTLTAYGPEGATTPAVADSQASLIVNADETLNGNSGCNGFSGGYQVDGDEITFSALVSTAMACEEPLMSQEGAVYKVLNGTATYKIDGDTLTITNGGTELVFTAAD